MVQISKAPTHSFRRTFISRSITGIFLLLFVLIFAGCETSSSTTNGTNASPTTSVASTSPTSVPEAPITPASASTTTGYPIKVYFSKFPDSTDKDPTLVFPVDRISPTTAVATFSIQLLIAGPTLNERDAGYFSELNSILSGPSSCSDPHPIGGPDFKLTLSKKGSQAEQGTATLSFCRTTNSPGVGADARIKSEINATLEQFSNITKVVILTQDGNCFGDGSGLNQCLK